MALVTFTFTAEAAEYHVRVDPPARYDHPHPNMVVKRLPASEIDAFCRGIGARAPLPIKGCAKGGTKACAVVIARNAPDIVLRHERAHCNGWSVRHPR